MPYDEDPYWGGFSKAKPKPTAETPSKPSDLSIAQRSNENATQVGGKTEKPGRAQNPSPLLVEWLAARGMVVK